MGGAAFIRHQYFENEQITLYQMRWNPKIQGLINMRVILSGQIKLQII